MAKHLKLIGNPGRGGAIFESLERNSHLRREKAKKKTKKVMSALKGILRFAKTKRQSKGRKGGR